MDSKEEREKVQKSVAAFQNIFKTKILTEEEKRAEKEKAKQELGRKPLRGE